MTKKNRSRTKDSPCAPGAVNADLLAQLADTLWLPADLTKAQRRARIQAAEAMLEDIGPADGTESMLACQMVAAHEAAMDCLRRAMLEDQPEGGREVNLKHAERLLALYTRQVTVLDRHRTRQRRAADQPDAEPPEEIDYVEVILDPDGTEMSVEEYFASEEGIAAVALARGSEADRQKAYAEKERLWEEARR